MVEFVGDLPAMPDHQAQQIGWLEHQHNRVAYLSWLLGVSGIRQTVRIVRGRLSGEKFDEQPLIAEDWRLDHPLNLTTAVADIATFVDIVRLGEYDLPQELDAVINGKPIIDIGANIGIFSAYSASRYPKSSVLAIEPHPRNFNILSQNALPYGLRTTILRRAFSLNQGDAALANPQVEELGHHVSYAFRDLLPASGEVTTAPTITPEDILRMLSYSGQTIGLMKVDIEGAEADIFSSAQIDPLLQATSVLAIEQHDRKRPGCSAAIDDATGRNNLVPIGGKGNTNYYRNNRLAV